MNNYIVLGDGSKCHSDEVASVSFNYDGTMVVSGSNDKSIKIWDVETRKCICTFSGCPSDYGEITETENINNNRL